MVRQLSPGGGLTRYEYGPFDQPVAMTGPDGVRTGFGYDHGLRLISVRRAGLTWSYGYDAAGRWWPRPTTTGPPPATVTTRPGSSPARSTPAASGSRSATTSWATWPIAISGGTTTTFGYDLAGRLVYARNPDAEVWLDRDPCGRITAETCNGRTVSSGYDVAGRRRAAGNPVRRGQPTGTTTRPGSRCG